MKQLEYTYTNAQELEEFFRNHFENKKVLVQLFCSSKTICELITQEINGFSLESTVNTIVSVHYKSAILKVTELFDDAKIIAESTPVEFNFFNSGPVVIFKREPRDDCWAVTHVTTNVSQWGYKASDFLNNEDAIKTAFYQDDFEKVRDTLMKSIEADENSLNQQYRINKKDGSIAWISEYTQIIRDAKGQPIELIGYLIDITQDKDKEVLYKGIINTTAEGFWMLDENLNITDVNYSLCAMLGFTKDEMIGKVPFDFIDSPDHGLCQAQADLIDDVSSRIYEISFKKKDGGILHTLTNATTMYDKAGTIKTFAFMTDISKQKQIEENLLKRHEEIEELNDSLESKITQEVEKNREKDQMMYQQARLASMGEMIGNIAHQWRQPLNIMALVMQDLYISDQLGNLTSKKVEDSYEKSNNLLQYMSQTIDDFRNFFKQGDEMANFSVKEAIDTVYNLVNTNLSYNQIECKIELLKDSQINGGVNEFKQVLINIINNAQEAISSNESENKVILISIAQEKSNAVIKIRDAGGGIEKKVLEKIFDPYFTTKEQTQGTGLGLYMSKQIIENSMCGSLSAKNIKGGAEFKITLPLKSL